MHNRRLVGLILLAAGFVSALFGIIGLGLSCVFWVIGTLLFAKSYLE